MSMSIRTIFTKFLRKRFSKWFGINSFLLILLVRVSNGQFCAVWKMHDFENHRVLFRKNAKLKSCRGHKILENEWSHDLFCNYTASEIGPEILASNLEIEIPDTIWSWQFYLLVYFHIEIDRNGLSDQHKSCRGYSKLSNAISQEIFRSRLPLFLIGKLWLFAIMFHYF